MAPKPSLKLIIEDREDFEIITKGDSQISGVMVIDSENNSQKYSKINGPTEELEIHLLEDQCSDVNMTFQLQELLPSPEIMTRMGFTPEEQENCQKALTKFLIKSNIFEKMNKENIMQSTISTMTAKLFESFVKEIDQILS